MEANKKPICGFLQDLEIPNNPINLFGLTASIETMPWLIALAKENNYTLKAYGKYTPGDDCLLISIYYAKATKIQVYIYSFHTKTNLDCMREVKEAVSSYYFTIFNKEETQMPLIENIDMDSILKTEIEKIVADYNLKMSALVAEREREIAECKKAYERTKIVETMEEAAFRQKAKMDTLVTVGFSEQQAFEMIMKDL